MPRCTPVCVGDVVLQLDGYGHLTWSTYEAVALDHTGILRTLSSSYIARISAKASSPAWASMATLSSKSYSLPVSASRSFCIKPQLSQFRDSRPFIAARSCIMLLGTNHRPLKSPIPNQSGSASPARHICYALPPTRNCSRGTSHTSNRTLFSWTARSSRCGSTSRQQPACASQ